MNLLDLARSALAAPSCRAATPAEVTELRRLIALILANASDADRAEALAVAVADPEAALVSLLALVRGAS